MMAKGASWTAMDRGVKYKTHFAFGSAPRSRNQLQSFSSSSVCLRRVKVVGFESMEELSYMSREGVFQLIGVLIL